MSLQSDVVQAREIHHEIEEIVRHQTVSDIYLARKLYEIKSTGLYKKAVGEGINTWVDYLRQPEVNVTHHRANKLIKIYKHLVVGLKFTTGELEGVPLYALSYISEKEVTDKEVAYNLLQDSRVLSEKDFKERYQDEVVSEARTYTYLIMRRCVETGSMEKVHNVKSEDIISAFNLQ